MAAKWFLALGRKFWEMMTAWCNAHRVSVTSLGGHEYSKPWCVWVHVVRVVCVWVRVVSVWLRVVSVWVRAHGTE